MMVLNKYGLLAAIMFSQITVADASLAPPEFYEWTLHSPATMEIFVTIPIRNLQQNKQQLIININPIKINGKIPEHHFSLEAVCTQDKKVLKKIDFSTYPLGSSGKFLFQFNKNSKQCINASENPSVRVKISLVIEKDNELIVEGDVLIQ